MKEKKEEYGNMLIVCMHIDDLIFTRNNSILNDEFKMTTEFEMIDVGL